MKKSGPASDAGPSSMRLERKLQKLLVDVASRSDADVSAIEKANRVPRACGPGSFIQFKAFARSHD